MSMADTERMRHCEERGQIVRCLMQEYQKPMTSVGSLQGALVLLGWPMTLDSISFHLQYLSESGYVKVWRVRDMPGGARTDRTVRFDPEEIRFAKLLPRGLQLHDGAIVEDPMVRFD